MSASFVPLSKSKYAFNALAYKIAQEELPKTFNSCSYKVTKAMDGIDVYVATICDSQVHSFIVHFAQFTPDLMKVTIQLDYQIPSAKCNEMFNNLPTMIGKAGLFRDKLRFHQPFCATLEYYADVTTNPLAEGNVPKEDYKYTMNPAEYDYVLFDMMSRIVRVVVDMVNDVN